MAQSRLNKAASIFTRTNGLIESKLIPWNERPAWFDIYKAFPPLRDPQYRSVLSGERIPPLPQKILYKEDELRAFYFNNIDGQDTVVLSSNHAKPIWELFIDTYKKLVKEDIAKEDLIHTVIEDMQNRGYYIKLNKKAEKKILSNKVSPTTPASSESTTTPALSTPISEVSKDQSELPKQNN